MKIYTLSPMTLKTCVQLANWLDNDIIAAINDLYWQIIDLLSKRKLPKWRFYMTTNVIVKDLSRNTRVLMRCF